MMYKTALGAVLGFLWWSTWQIHGYLLETGKPVWDLWVFSYAVSVSIYALWKKFTE